MTTLPAAWVELTVLFDEQELASTAQAPLISSPSKGEDNENAQLVQRFKIALRKNVEQVEAQLKIWENQIFSPELRAKMSASEMKRKSDTVLSMHKVCWSMSNCISKL